MKRAIPILIFGPLLLLLSACQPPAPTPFPTPEPSPSPTPGTLPPPTSIWMNDQIGVTWGDTPVVQDWDYGYYWRTPERVALVRQSDTPWAWDRWSAFWFWIEQPHRPDPWGPGRYNFAGTLDAVHPDDPNKVAIFNIGDPAAANPNVLIVLDGIARPYDCIATGEQGSLCYGSKERIQGLFLNPLLNGSANPHNHWADYVYHTVNYFKQFGIHHYQAYNEPNLGYWNGGDDPEGEGWANDYARLVEVTLMAAQAANPQARIVLAASVSDLNQYQRETWLDWAYRYIGASGLNKDVDIAIHSYAIPAWTREMKDQIQMLWPLLATRPIWITESGIALCSDAITGHLCANTEEEQAAYVIQQFAYALTIGAERVFHHRLADDCEADFGLYANDQASGSGDQRVCSPTGTHTPRAALTTLQVISNYLQGGQFIEGESLLPSIATDHARLVFNQPDQKVTVLWATKNHPVSVNLSISPSRCTYLIDQAGNWQRITGPSYQLTLPGATTTEVWKGLPIIGGYTYLLIETNKSCGGIPPTGSASVICENGWAVGTALQGYDPDSGLASLTVSCSAARTYDLSWTQPGVLYAGVVGETPLPGRTCTLTLTDRDGLSISQTLESNCGGGGGGGNPGGDHPDDNYSAADAPIPPGQFLAAPAGARMPPRAAILNRGAAHGLWWLLMQLGEPAIRIEPDFDPLATARQYPVLLIPSGGLYGLASPPSQGGAGGGAGGGGLVTLRADGVPVWSCVIVHWSLLLTCPVYVTA